MNWIEHRRRQARSRRIRRFLLGVGLTLPAVLLAGAALPAVRITRQSVSLDRTPESVWQILVDFDAMPRWRSDLRALERIPDREGRTAWREIGPGGVRIVQVLTADPPRLLVLRRAEGNRIGIRSIELVGRDRGGTVVTVIEPETVRNPVRRILVRLGAHRGPASRLLRDLTQVVSGRRPEIAVEPEF